jgi:hypothetical protein
MLTIRELEIIKAALEGDIIQQKENIHKDHPAWKHWLEDSEKLLKKVSMKLFEMKSRKQLLDELNGREVTVLMKKGETIFPESEY